MSSKSPEIRFNGFTDDWEQRKLKEVAEFNPKSELPNKFEYIDLESVVGTNLISHRTENKDSAPSRAQRLARKGDVFYQTVRPYQKNNYLFDLPYIDYVFSTGYAQMRPNIDSYFLLNCVQEERFVKAVLDRSTGTSYPAINSKDLADIKIKVPKESGEQEKIGILFNYLDKTIALHQRELDNLLKSKKGFLQKMFPKRGEMIPELRFSEYSNEWNSIKLGKIGTTYSGLSGKTKEDFGHGEAEFVTYKNVFSNAITNINETENVEIDEKQNRVQYGDVFFTTSSETPEEVGMSSVWLENKDNTYLNSFCFGFRPTDNVNYLYLAYLLRSSEVRKQFINLAQGISRYNISKKKTMDIILMIPNLEEQEKIGTFFKQLDDKIDNKQQHIENLKQTKKAFLQKMFV